MITSKRGFKRKYAYGGAGIFDTIASFLAKLFTGNVGRQLTSAAINVGKDVAKEGAKKALEAGKSAAVDMGSKLLKKALTPKSKKILEKVENMVPATAAHPVASPSISSLIDGSAIPIQDLVKKLNRRKKGSRVKIL